MSKAIAEFGNYNMEFVNEDYLSHVFDPETFNGVITDPPYAGSNKNQLGEENFNFDKFMSKTDRETKSTAFLITFSNFMCAVDFVNASRKTNWQFYTIQIWDKRTGKPIARQYAPIRTTEYILYFRKGPSKQKMFQFNFATGTTREPYDRKTIAGGLVPEAAKDLDFSYEMYKEMFAIEDFVQKDPYFSHSMIKELPTYTIEESVIDDKSQPKGARRIHPTQKPAEFSYYFAHVVGGADDKIALDPFCGSGNLLKAFPNAVGVDIVDWRDGTGREEFDLANQLRKEHKKKLAEKRKAMKQQMIVEEIEEEAEEAEEAEEEGNEARRNRRKRRSIITMLRPAYREYIALKSILSRKQR